MPTKLSHVLPLTTWPLTIWLAFILYHASQTVNRRQKEIDPMHPLLNQQMAKLHMEELQREATAMRLANSANANTSRKTGDHSSRSILLYLLFGLHTPAHTGRMHAALRSVGFMALGVGSLLGSLLSTRLGLLPAILLSSTICLAVSLPILARSIIMLKQRLLQLAHSG